MWSKHPRVNDRLSSVTQPLTQHSDDAEFDAPAAQRGGHRLLDAGPAAFESDAGDDTARQLPRWFARWDPRARKAALLLITGLALVIAWWWWTGQPETVQTNAASAEISVQKSPDVDPELALEAVSGTVLVHVVGKVAEPGVVELPIGSRVQDAVEAAGGATNNKALESVNLARLVVDGEQIVVGAPAGEATSSKISINSASAAQLDELPGVGPAIAERIVQWRETNGPFTSVDELTEVSGIGPSILEQIRDLASM
ncbi:MAG: ComEA family DNA-binding protein [Actinomycetota bacterium]|nr:ComEA family DNA-binding protein [Actinomycetota bacterium]